MYERLIIEAEEQNIEVYERKMPKRLKGLYYNGIIQINSAQTEPEKACILAEELGHYHTTVGDITDQTKINNRKQEETARRWAYRRMVALSDLISAFEAHCRTIEEFAEYTEVTIEFFCQSVNYYRKKHGMMTVVGDDYIVYFEPFGILKRRNENED